MRAPKKHFPGKGLLAPDFAVGLAKEKMISGFQAMKYYLSADLVTSDYNT